MIVRRIFSRAAIVVGLSLAISGLALAGGNNGVETQSKAMFSAMTAGHRPAIVKSAGGGVISGGDFEMRSRVTNLRLANFKAPSFSAGCGGISAYFGSLSLISKQQLVDALKAIASNAVGYAFELALSALCPNCASKLAAFQAKADKWTSASINSCKLAQQAVDKSGAKGAINDAFGSLGRSMGLYDDAADGSKQGKDTTAAADVQSKDPAAFKKLIPGNIVWNGLVSNNAASWFEDSAGTRMLEDVMSMTGTVIVCIQSDDTANHCPAAAPAKDDGRKGQTKVLIRQPTLDLRKFVLGSGAGAIERWSCGGATGAKECLDPTREDIDAFQGFRGMILDIMLGRQTTPGGPRAGGYLSRIATNAEATGRELAEQNGLLSLNNLLINGAVHMARAGDLRGATTLVSLHSSAIAARIAYRMMVADLEVVRSSLAERDSTSDVMMARKMVADAQWNALQQFNQILQEDRSQLTGLQAIRGQQAIAPPPIGTRPPVGTLRNGK